MSNAPIDLSTLELERRFSDQVSKKKELSDTPSPPPFIPFEKPKGKAIDCYKCGHIFEVPNHAFSTECPTCNLHMYLDDVYFTEKTKKTQIYTHGDLYIHKNAKLKKLIVFCKNLYLEGVASGNLHCKNTLYIESSCRIDGEIKAQNLFIAKKQSVSFRYPAKVNTALIEGELTGNIIAQNAVILKPGAVIMGDIQAEHLELPIEAEHHGMYSPYNPYHD